MEDNGVDVQLDEVGIHLDVPLYCYTCHKRMKLISPTRYKCPGCGFEFEQKE
ncbi:MAG TPA: hypothetical protein VJB08_07195 [Candidatus Nanoarchaeia archaeon]|nr:hypothetical protein [Candidatus Nanoarchaeia archaeon]